VRRRGGGLGVRNVHGRRGPWGQRLRALLEGRSAPQGGAARGAALPNGRPRAAVAQPAAVPGRWGVRRGELAGRLRRLRGAL
ncbi:MAG: hypothetical protein AVDCRST_MAG02-4093, partial [uncultured Rubrobacteraceae bacterium]